MRKTNLYKVTIYNDDRTTFSIKADNKKEACLVYFEIISKKECPGLIDEDKDFEIVFDKEVYEKDNNQH